MNVINRGVTRLPDSDVLLRMTKADYELLLGFFGTMMLDVKPTAEKYLAFSALIERINSEAVRETEPEKIKP